MIPFLSRYAEYALTFAQAFRHDFDAGNSPEAQRILQARCKGVSAISRYTGFLVSILYLCMGVPIY